jgi:hypothetical protein
MMFMKKLSVWLDDKRPMPDGFDIWVKTAEHAAKLIESGEVSHLDFDHDLGASTNTGYAVACYIEQLAYDGTIAPITWSIHSANPPGKKAIKQAMESADRFWEEQGQS